MKISVIVPAYNYSHFLADVYSCLTEQTFSNWECIIIDNGSTDNTSLVVKDFIKKDPRFTYFQIEKSNPSVARNFGIKHASGDYIQFLDADDIISLDKFEKQLAVFSENKYIDITYGNYRLTNEQLQNHLDPKKNMMLSAVPFNDFVWRWEKDLTIPVHSFLFKKSCFEKWGIMDEQIRTHEDWEMQLNFSSNHAQYHYQKELVAFYRIHKSSSSRTDRTENRSDTFYVLLKYLRSKKLSGTQKLLCIFRYVDFVGETLIDKFRLNNVDVFKAISFYKRPVLNSISFIVFPLFLITKVIRKIF